MNFDEFEYTLHTRENQIHEETGVEKLRIYYLKNACNQYMYLKKLDATKGKSRNHRKVIEKKIFGGDKFYIEYFTEENEKVCGSSLKGYRPWIRCLKKAGHGTLHPGYGMCKEHEMNAPLAVRNDIWLQINQTYNNTQTLMDIVLRAERLQKMSGDAMDADMAFLEIARQSIMRKIEKAEGIATREQENDLIYISDVMTKIKERKIKAEQANWIDPAKVGAMILQVLEAVTKGETKEVRQRIALRASTMSNIIIPSLKDEDDLKPWERSREVITALEIAEKHAPDMDYGSIPEISGYTIDRPPIIKTVPNYKKPRKLEIRDGVTK